MRQLRLRRPSVPLVVIVAVGVVLRAGWAIYASRTPVGLHDPGLYRVLSDSFAAGHGYSYPPPFNGPGIGYAPTAYYPPGYVLLLGSLEWVTEHTPIPDGPTGTAVAINLVAGAAAIVLVYAIARHIANERTGLVAAAIVALWPNLIVHTAVTLSETLFIAVMLLAIWFAVRVPPRGTAWPRLAAAGVALGLATLVRPVALPLLAAFAVAWLVARVGWKLTLARVGVVTIACVLVLVPWLVRNAVTMGRPVLSTNTGDNLCVSRQPGATGAFQITEFCNADLVGLHRPESELRKDDDTRRKAFEFVREHPGTELRLWISRLRYGYSNDADGIRATESYDEDRFLPDWLRTSLTAAANLWASGVGLVALVSLWWWLRRRDEGGWLIFASIIGVGVIPIVAFFGDPRFHIPIDPLLAILAAGLLSGWVLRARAPAHA